MLRSRLITIRNDSAALAVALVDAETGLCVEQCAPHEGGFELDLPAAAARHSRLWRVARAHRSDLRLRGPVESIVVTEPAIVHVLRPIDGRSSLVLYAVAARATRAVDALVAALERAAEPISRELGRADASSSARRARSA